MKRSRFTEEQIFGMLKEVEVGLLDTREAWPSSHLTRTRLASSRIINIITRYITIKWLPRQDSNLRPAD